MTLVFSGQAVMYVVRERGRLWDSRPSGWLMATSVIDVAFIATLACLGVVMTALPALLVLGLLIGAVLFAFILDVVKVNILARPRIV